MQDPPPSEAPAPPDAPKARARPRVIEFETMPKALRGHRERIRSMMQDRCALPGSPIPLAMANRAADWIMMVTVVRANRRSQLGHEPFPDQETLANDIARAAETVEICFVANIEEVSEESPLILSEGARRGLRTRKLGVPRDLEGRAAGGHPGDDPERELPRGKPEGDGPGGSAA